MPIKQYVYVDGGDTTIHVSYDTDRETLQLYGVHNTAPLLLQNAAERKDPSNGFTRSREGACGRKIASIDPIVYRSWQQEFERIGGKRQADWVPDWRRFVMKKLAENPQYYTVDKLVSHNANEGSIIVK